MRNGRHYNSYIQKDYNSGYKFSFSVLEYCNPSQLNQRKNYWIRQLNTFNNGYNQTGRVKATLINKRNTAQLTYIPPKTQNKKTQNINHEKTKRENYEKKRKIALEKYKRRFKRLEYFLQPKYYY